jgi:hypothetical protein
MSLALVLALMPVPPAHAALVTLTGSDGFGTSSFNSAGTCPGGCWSDGMAPQAGNDYITNENRMRTPADGNSYSFAGDSLTVNNTNALNGGLMYKGTGNAGILTINNLILNGGRVHHQNGLGDLFRLAGNINVLSNSTIHAKQGNIDITADISGSGNLDIPVTDASGENNRYVTLLAANSGYSGSITVPGRFRLGDGGGLTFDIGPSGVNNSVSGTGTAAFNGIFSFDLTGASSNPGDSWTIASVANQSFGATFSVSGFAAAGDVWVSGVYRFDEATGILAVIPEPGSLLLMALGGLAIACRRR